MMSRFRRLTAAFIPLSVASAVLVLFAGILPVSAATGSLCTAFDQMLCIGDTGSVQAGDQVQTVNSPGRTMDFAAGVGGTGVIRFHNFNLCLGLPNANSFNVKVEPCNSRGVSFKWVSNNNNGHFFVNQLTGAYLTGFNSVGGIVAVCGHPCPGGGDQVWFGP